MTTADPPAEVARGSPGRRRRALVVLAVFLAGAGLFWGWRWYTQPALLELHLDGADPEVAVAIRRAQETVRTNRRSASAWGELGMVLMANKFEEESTVPFARAEALDPADPRWPYLRGVALLGRDPDQALPCLRRAAAVSLDTRQLAACRLRLAETLAANGHEEEAEAQFRQVPAGSLSPCVEYGLGVLAAGRGDLPGSRVRLTRCADNPLTRQKAAAQLAVLSRRLGEEEAAAGQEKRAAQLPADPSWPDPFLLECLTLVAGKEKRLREVNSLEQQGQVSEMLEVLRGVARDYPDASSFLTLGISLGRAGRFQESEEQLRRCLEREPRLVRALYYLSLALFAQGEALRQQPGRQADATAKFEEAAQQARRATELDPRHGEAWFQLGLTLWSLGRRAEALAAFRQAVATRPQLAEAHLWLGKVLAEEGKKDEAVLHLRDAVRYAAPDDPRPRQALEQILGGTRP
jgi:tetratricopeptide (TPR) repeat protein